MERPLPFLQLRPPSCPTAILHRAWVALPKGMLGVLSVPTNSFLGTLPPQKWHPKGVLTIQRFPQIHHCHFSVPINSRNSREETSFWESSEGHSKKLKPSLESQCLVLHV
uniref:Uncharacterized protein n=1 Tax=Anguilla anguilla TaxID=7936 RepID=A0A0E9WWA4_ANGAN